MTAPARGKGAVFDEHATEGALASFDAHWEVTQLFVHEAELLDDWRYREWMDMLTDDFNYAIPVPVTRDDPARPNFTPDAFLVEETKVSLDLWMRRYDPEVFEFAWGENPRQRTRRFLTNIRVRESHIQGEYDVSVNELLSFARQSDPAILTTALRKDVVRRVDGALKVAQRRVYLDQNIHTLTHLRLIF